MADKVKPDAIDKGMVRVFVYGSLKRGQPNAIVLRKSGATFVGPDSITGNYQMLDFGPFPAVTKVDEDVGSTTIFGEVWAGDEEMLAACDILEGHPSFFCREKLWTNGGVNEEDDERRRAWMYMLPEEWEEEAPDVVEFGCWKPVDRDYDYWGTDNLGEKPRGEEQNEKTAKA